MKLFVGEARCTYVYTFPAVRAVHELRGLKQRKVYAALESPDADRSAATAEVLRLMNEASQQFALDMERREMVPRRLIVPAGLALIERSALWTLAMILRDWVQPDIRIDLPSRAGKQLSSFGRALMRVSTKQE